jgi:hypothetical protein
MEMGREEEIDRETTSGSSARRIWAAVATRGCRISRKSARVRTAPMVVIKSRVNARTFKDLFIWDLL